MTRHRLREAHTENQLTRIYSKQHSHGRWRDHRLRVPTTLATARWLAPERVDSAADLSCGDGTILDGVYAETKYYGDFLPGSLDRYDNPLYGPIESTIGRIPRVDLFILTETLEHLDDPDEVLYRVRGKSDRMVLSTPVDNWDDANPEHYWAWSRQDVEHMLWQAGFNVDSFVQIDCRMMSRSGYQYGVWGCH